MELNVHCPIHLHGVHSAKFTLKFTAFGRKRLWSAVSTQTYQSRVSVCRPTVLMFVVFILSLGIDVSLLLREICATASSATSCVGTAHPLQPNTAIGSTSDKHIEWLWAPQYACKSVSCPENNIE